MKMDMKHFQGFNRVKLLEEELSCVDAIIIRDFIDHIPHDEWSRLMKLPECKKLFVKYDGAIFNITRREDKFMIEVYDKVSTDLNGAKPYTVNILTIKVRDSRLHIIDHAYLHRKLTAADFTEDSLVIDFKDDCDINTAVLVNEIFDRMNIDPALFITRAINDRYHITTSKLPFTNLSGYGRVIIHVTPGVKPILGIASFPTIKMAKFRISQEYLSGVDKYITHLTQI